MGEVPWRDIVDRAVVFRYTGYAKTRGPALDAELKRVGLFGFADTNWTFPDPFVSRFMRVFDYKEPLGGFDVTLNGFYSAVKTSYELGHERLLCCEDDVRFLSDLGWLTDALLSIPEDFQLAKLSWMRRGGIDVAEVLDRPRVNGLWVPSTGVVTRDSCAMIFSRDGMRWYIDALERGSAVVGANRRPSLPPCDAADRFPLVEDDARRVYLAIPLLARQVDDLGVRMSRVKFDPRYRPFFASGGRSAYGGTT